MKYGQAWWTRRGDPKMKWHWDNYVHPEGGFYQCRARRFAGMIEARTVCFHQSHPPKKSDRCKFCNRKYLKRQEAPDERT